MFGGRVGFINSFSIYIACLGSSNDISKVVFVLIFHSFSKSK